MEEHLVSIITPTYNSEKFIEETIQGILSQTYKNWELLITDDCSTDSTWNLLQDYASKDERIKIFKLSKNSGPGVARNNSIKNSNGRFIAFCDSDDIWLPTKLEHQIPLFQDDNIVIVFSNYKKFTDSYEKRLKIVTAPNDVSFSKALYGNCIGNLTGVYDVGKVGKVYCMNVGHEDYVLWLTILKKGGLAKNTNSVEAKYRVMQGSVSSNKVKAIVWTWKIYREIFKFNFFKSLIYFIGYVIRAFFKYF